MTPEEMNIRIENYKEQIGIIKDNDEYKKIKKMISITWKEDSYKMLDSAFKAYKKAKTGSKEKEDAKNAFTLAVTKMIGGYGSVARTVSKKKKNKFLDTILTNYPNIEEGLIGINDSDVFNIFNLKNELKLENDPLSYITKICHIVNPKKCPLIWDSQIRDALDIRNSNDGKEKYKKLLEISCRLLKDYKPDDVYRIESTIWAGITNDKEVNDFKEKLTSEYSSNHR